MAQTVTRISVGFTHEKHHQWPAWQRRQGWPPINLRAASPNVYYYVSGNRTTNGNFLGRLG